MTTALIDSAAIRMPRRLALARTLCRHMPPIAAQRLRDVLYPYERAKAVDMQVVVASQTGSPFVARTSDFHMYPFAVHGFFEWRNWAVARAVCAPGDTIVEVGANVGTETIGFSDIVGPEGRVVALEPLPANVDLLHQSLALARAKNIDVRAVAVSDRDGVVRFAAPVHAWSSGVGYVASADAENARTTEVPAVRLDALAIGPVRAIFSDTEGHEVAVLRGAREPIRRDRPVIVLEASPKLLARAGDSMQSLHDELRALGYTAHRITRFGLAHVRSLDPPHAGNWLCLHETERVTASRIASVLRRCALMPLIPGLNPLCS